jgi:ribosome-associated protein
MRSQNNTLSSEQRAQLVVHGMQEKKGQAIVLLDLRHLQNAIADFFVICTGTSDTQVDAIAGSIEAEVHKASGNNPWQREGLQNKEWVLIDYVDIVAHVFLKEKRKFYALEELWGDAKVIPVESVY